MEKHPEAELIKKVVDGVAQAEWRCPDATDYGEKEWRYGPLDEIVQFPYREWRAKPTEPEKVYPVTQMSLGHIQEIHSNPTRGAAGVADLVAVANAALRHAVDNGYLVTPEQAKKMANESFHFGVDNALAGMPKQDTAERDQKVAQAVYLAAQNILDSRITWAVEHARKTIMAELLESLPAIVKEVKP